MGAPSSPPKGRGGSVGGSPEHVPPSGSSPPNDANPVPRTIDSGEPPAGDAASTAPSPAIEPDSSTDDEGYQASLSTSYVTSLASDILRGVEEKGRLYAAYGIHKPWMPVDDLELDRNDLQHFKFTLLLNDQLFIAPIVSNPQKILDLGTGSGIWAMDVADAYPSAEVIGVDTAPVQPKMLPPNLIFEIDDIEHEWLWPESSFDLIHGRA